MVARAPEDDVEVELPGVAGPVTIPRAQLITNEASERSTRWVMRFTWFTLAVLLLLCAIGPHIPSGE